jgi:hypothetical protein
MNQETRDPHPQLYSPSSLSLFPNVLAMLPSAFPASGGEKWIILPYRRVYLCLLQLVLSPVSPSLASGVSLQLLLSLYNLRGRSKKRIGGLLLDYLHQFKSNSVCEFCFDYSVCYT